MLFLIGGCSTFEVDWSKYDGMAIIEDTFGGPTVVEIDGSPPQRMTHNIVTVVPFAYIEPGKHVFKIRIDSNDLLVGGDIEIIEFEAVLEEGTYTIEERNGRYQFLPKEEKQTANQASHTMSATEELATTPQRNRVENNNARFFNYDPMENNLNRLGIST